ncbi:Alpha/Beta hydrolase protein [Scheffersomyces coipomensis]|uniref:Alpha/Beta hydrolase protein n=1 Tax=Scheffersomyces coipomensis TaxID=1788519 RepID=UPI00315DE08D
MIGLGWIRSTVDNYYPNKPIKFISRSKNQDQTANTSTLPEILQSAVPELYQDNYFYINPLLSTGHFQTAYTAINNFEHIDHVHYKRRILPIENKTYRVEEDDIKYDRWEGSSTVALDYVVPESLTDPDHLNFRPSSQTHDLPPRTEYLDPAKELDLIKDDSKPLLIALHGLSGGSYEAYIRAVLYKITSAPYDFDAVVLNSRGCANHTITSPQLYNGLWTNDLRYLINEHIKPKFPNKRIYLIGFSLGGAILANYLGQEGSNVYPMIKGSCIVGTPWDFPDSAIHLRESLIGHNVYSPTMCQNLLKLLNTHYENEGFLKHDKFINDYKMDPSKFKAVKYLKDFDDLFTSKLFGFNSADEYYRHASPVQRLLKVRVPTVILSSKDDPITGFRTLPINEVKLNPYTTLVTTTTGGHLGWFTVSGKRWYPEPIAKLLSELDQNWQVGEVEDELDLPVDIDKSWKHDRLVYGML